MYIVIFPKDYMTCDIATDSFDWVQGQIWYENIALSTLEPDIEEIYKTAKRMLFSFFIVCILENSYFSQKYTYANVMV